MSLWSDDPKERLRAARQLTSGERQQLYEALRPKDFSWPYGMPTSINPYVVVLGLSPGNSPAASDERASYWPPTAGSMHTGFIYQDGRQYWNKVRLLIEGMLSVVSNLDSNDALSVAGAMNLDIVQAGESASVQVNLNLAEWVVDVILNNLRPRYLICLGLWGRFRGDLRPIFDQLSSHANIRTPTRTTLFSGYTGNHLTYREFDRSRPDGGKLTLVIWPQHPSRVPFTSLEMWIESVVQFSNRIATRP